MPPRGCCGLVSKALGPLLPHHCASYSLVPQPESVRPGCLPAAFAISFSASLGSSQRPHVPLLSHCLPTRWIAARSRSASAVPLRRKISSRSPSGLKGLCSKRKQPFGACPGFIVFGFVALCSSVVALRHALYLRGRFPPAIKFYPSRLVLPLVLYLGNQYLPLSSCRPIGHPTARTFSHLSHLSPCLAVRPAWPTLFQGTSWRQPSRYRANRIGIL